MIAAFAQPARAIPTFRPTAAVFGPSALDKAVGAYRQARNACNYEQLLTNAYANLGRANRTRAENRRQARTEAFRAINRIRAAQRAACALRDRAEIALYAAGGLAADVDAVDFAPMPDDGFTGVRLEDDPDFAGATWGGRH